MLYSYFESKINAFNTITLFFMNNILNLFDFFYQPHNYNGFEG